MMEVIEKQWKTIAAVFILVIVSGVGYGFVSQAKTKKEHQAQESYFLTEKKFLDLKAKKADPASKEVVDFSVLKKDFEKVIADFPGSKAAQMAAIYTSDILISENNKAAALGTLQKVETNDAGLVNSLVQQQIALLLADQDKCSDALAIWQKILDRKSARFLHNDTKIQQALCYQKMNDFKKAEEILTNLANQKSESQLDSSATSKEAEKYLRLIQFKKVSGT